MECLLYLAGSDDLINRAESPKDWEQTFASGDKVAFNVYLSRTEGHCTKTCCASRTDSSTSGLARINRERGALLPVDQSRAVRCRNNGRTAIAAARADQSRIYEQAIATAKSGIRLPVQICTLESKIDCR